jgi:hypothetical protein
MGHEVLDAGPIDIMEGRTDKILGLGAVHMVGFNDVQSHTTTPGKDLGSDYYGLYEMSLNMAGRKRTAQ